MTEKNISKSVIILSIAFYISSLTQPAYCTSDCKSSLMVLLAGPLGIFTEIGALATLIMDKVNGHASSVNPGLGSTFTWLANPIIIFSLFTFRHNKRTALSLSVISTILILLFLTFDKVADDEAGHYNKVTQLKIGYWLWLLSSITILIGSLIMLKLKNVNNKNKQSVSQMSL